MKIKTLDERGFVLPLTLFLVIMLGISGMGFLHLDFLERLSTLNTTGNFSAFYLANTGIERARENFKIPDSLSWTTVLNGGDANYPTDVAPSPLLCPYYDPLNPGSNRGCVIPPFQTVAKNPGNIAADGSAVVTPDFPFSGTFDDGNYSVRAYNDEATTTDNNMQLIFRAMGNVRGEQKVIEVKVVAGTTSKLINCQNADPSLPCPDSQNKNTGLTYMEGKAPASTPNLPEFLPTYYQNTNNFACTTATPLAPNTTLVDGNPHGGQIQIQSNTCYYSTGDITISSVGNSGWSNVVVYSEKNLSVKSNSQAQNGVSFTNTIFIGVKSIDISGNLSIVSPRTSGAMYPAFITTGALTGLNNSVSVDGNIYAASDKIDYPEASKTGSLGTDQKPINPNQVNGAIFGDDVYLKSGAQNVSDNDPSTNQPNPLYYAFMPGFKYPNDLKTTAPIASTWRERQ